MNKKILHRAAAIYPRTWRSRYGVEFAALLEDSGGGWRPVADVLANGVAMRIMKTDYRFVLGLGLVGLTIGSLMAYRMPSRFRSEATAQISAGPGVGPGELRDAVFRTESDMLSRSSLARLINDPSDPSSDLYKWERERYPLEDVIEAMKARDLRVAANADDPQRIVFKVSYEGYSPEAAQRTTGKLLAHVQANPEVKTLRFDVLEPPSAPIRPLPQNRFRPVLEGLAAGLTLGILIAGVRRWPRVAVMGLAGGLVALIASFAIPDRYVSSAFLIIRDRTLADQLTARVFGDHDTIMEILKTAGPGTKRKDLSIVRNNQALTVRIVARDRQLAQSAVQRTVTALFDARQPRRPAVSESGMDVVDPPSLPFDPVFPNRPVIAGFGLLAGLVTGVGLRARREAAL